MAIDTLFQRSTLTLHSHMNQIALRDESEQPYNNEKIFNKEFVK